MRLFELPCKGWEGWHMHSGKLWTPEGHGFTPDCQSWWSLLVRQARMYREVSGRERQLDIALHRMRAGGASLPPSAPSAMRSGDGSVAGAPATPAPAGGRAAKPSGPNLLLEHFTTIWVEKPGFHWGNRFGEIPAIRLVTTNKGVSNV